MLLLVVMSVTTPIKKSFACICIRAHICARHRAGKRCSTFAHENVSVCVCVCVCVCTCVGTQVVSYALVKCLSTSSRLVLPSQVMAGRQGDRQWYSRADVAQCMQKAVGIDLNQAVQVSNH